MKNVLYIHTHDTGRAISPYGFGVHTPNYEEFCNDSLLFQNAYSVAPTCSPSRAGLLTGVYPHQNGMLGLAQRGFELKHELHLANFLKNKNYNTALCGVQHEIGYYTDHELAIGTLGYDINLTTDNSQFSEKELVIWDKNNAESLVNFLSNYQDKKPFFISYGMHSTHRAFPDEIHEDENVNFSNPLLNLPNNEISRLDFAKYKTSLRMADDNLGLIIQALKDNNLYDSTIIILTTDHGLAYPFQKCTLNDSGIGVLLAVRVPGFEKHFGTFDGLVSHIDIFPTLCDLLEIEKPDYLEGQSFAKLFNGEKFDGNEVVFGEINFHTSYEPVRSVRNNRYKYIKFFDMDYLKINKSNIDESPLKTFYYENGLEDFKKPSEALYDLYYDRYETNNLIENPTYKKEVEYFRKKLDDFMVNTDDPLLNGVIEIDHSWKVNKRESYLPGSKNQEDYENMGAI